MHQLMKIVGYTAATVGLAYVIKQAKQRRAGFGKWHKIKVEGEKSTESAPYEMKREGEKRTGTRYGSNPVSY
jgi:hypothetical protein